LFQLSRCLLLFQIISFLKQNAHPRVADRIPVVLENITDEVRSHSSLSVELPSLIMQKR